MGIDQGSRTLLEGPGLEERKRTNERAIQYRRLATEHGTGARDCRHGEGLRRCWLRCVLDCGSLSLVAQAWLRGTLLDGDSRCHCSADATHSAWLGHHLALHETPGSGGHGSACHARPCGRPLPPWPWGFKNFHERNRRG